MALRRISPELRDAWAAAGWWSDQPLHRAVDDTAAVAPDRLAVADQHDRYTYAELVRHSSALARWLLDQELRPGTAVALQSANRVAIPLVHLACDRADLTFLPVPDAWHRIELRHVLERSGAAVFLVPPASDDVDAPALARELREELPDLRIIGTTEGGALDVALDEILAGSDGAPCSVERDADAPRLVMATSGTTELSRLSLWTANNLRFFLQQFGLAVGLAPGDVALGVAPANTGSTGYVFPVLAPLLHGASSVLLEHWSAPLALELLQREAATLATAVPTQLIKMLQDPALAEHDYSSLRVFNNAGAPLAPHAAMEVERVFGCTIQTVYGASDGGVPVMTRVSDPPEKRFTTVGRTLPATELRIAAPDMAALPPGEVGEVLWRNPTKTFGYLNDAERTDSMFWDDGFYRSGDLGVVDEDGYLRIVGRAKDVIIRGGQNLSPREIEEVIATEPNVSEVAVVGIPDPVYGERACACVVLRAGGSLSLDGLSRFLAAHDLVKYKWPERLELFTELPKSAGAKVSKVELRAAVLARAERDQGGERT
jgi:acyl-CoA synthetase (AMP-forming)/AMP-acid ligase II